MKIYGHVLDKMKRDAANKVDDAFGPSPEPEATSQATNEVSGKVVN